MRINIARKMALKTHNFLGALVVCSLMLPGVANACINSGGGYCSYPCGSGGGEPPAGAECTDEVFDFVDGGTPEGASLLVDAWSDSLPNGSFDNYIGEVTLVTGSPGLGVQNNDYNDSDYMDNAGDYDFLFFDFGDVEGNITMLDIGAAYNDSDVTILAYTGLASDTLDLDTAAIKARFNNGSTQIDYFTTNGIANGWTTFQYTTYGAQTGWQDISSLTTGTSSTWWIVGASFANADGQSDKVKIAKICAALVPSETAPTPVPEPATLLLLAAGVPLLRRRKR